MIEDIVNNKIKDGQLNNCPLTFQELETIKATFGKTLRSMLHSRIDYPKEGEPMDRGTSRGEKEDSEGLKITSPRTLASETHP